MQFVCMVSDENVFFGLPYCATHPQTVVSHSYFTSYIAPVEVTGVLYFDALIYLHGFQSHACAHVDGRLCFTSVLLWSKWYVATSHLQLHLHICTSAHLRNWFSPSASHPANCLVMFVRCLVSFRLCGSVVTEGPLRSHAEFSARPHPSIPPGLAAAYYVGKYSLTSARPEYAFPKRREYMQIMT